MDDMPQPRRVFGDLVGRTANMTKAPVLAGYLRVLLNRLPGYDRVPAAVEFNVMVYGEEDSLPTIHVLVYGLTDEFLTYSRTMEQSTSAIYVEAAVRMLVATLDWASPDDPDDHRFLYDVTLLTEDQQKSDLFPRDRVWVTSLEPQKLHMPSPW